MPKPIDRLRKKGWIFVAAICDVCDRLETGEFQNVTADNDCIKDTSVVEVSEACRTLQAYIRKDGWVFSARCPKCAPN